MESERVSQQMLCGLLGRSRQGYYKLRRREEREAIKAELVIQEVVSIRSEQKRIGVRKLYHMLQPFLLEQEIKMGRDQLNEVLREHGLLVRRRRLRKPRTTVSCWWRRYPNLIRDYVPTGANQLWVSDITYVRVGLRFGFLSLITDGYSRRIVGYKLFRDLSARGCLGALKMALRNNPQREGLIHHSDRGMQYSSTEYVRLLGKERISMTENSDPRENAIAERVNGILKDELLEKGYPTFKEARESIDRAVSIYNHLRPHSSVDYLTPAEAHTHTGELKKRWKNYFSTRTNGPNAQAMA
jgi:putative transposase